MPGRKRKLSIEHNMFSSAKKMEEYFGIKNSIFAEKNQKALDKALILSYEKRFANWEDGKDCKIFRVDTIIYYCTTWSEYGAFDVRTAKIIGRAVLENDWLQTIDVDKSYRKKGIGTNLIKAIVKTIGNNFHIPARGLPNINSYFLTEEGAALINSCIRKKIITEEQCMLDVPPRTPSTSPLRTFG